nr:allene oxide synthase 3-like [Ipomoea batatas]
MDTHGYFFALQCTDEEVEHSYEEFYEDVHTEFLKFGEIVNFKVCRNSSSHLRGNVYVHYKSLDSAVLAYQSINGRYFAGKQEGHWSSLLPVEDSQHVNSFANLDAHFLLWSIVGDTYFASYLVKKGETILGVQPFATKDPKVFENPDKYIPDRFVGEGKKLIEYVYWSNGRGTDIPTANDKQCLGRNMIILLSRLHLAEFFLRYDTFTVEVSQYLSSSIVKFKSLSKASSST